MKRINLAVFRYETIGTGLKALNRLNLDSDLKVMEASSLGVQGFLLMLEGAINPLAEYRDLMHEADGLLESELFEGIDQRILDAIYCLYSGPIKDEVVIIESDQILPLLECCQRALSISGDIFEIKIDRGARGYHSAVITGASLSFLSEEGFDDIELTHIRGLSPALKAYFS